MPTPATRAAATCEQAKAKAIRVTWQTAKLHPIFGSCQCRQQHSPYQNEQFASRFDHLWHSEVGSQWQTCSSCQSADGYSTTRMGWLKCLHNPGTTVTMDSCGYCRRCLTLQRLTSGYWSSWFNQLPNTRHQSIPPESDILMNNREVFMCTCRICRRTNTKNCFNRHAIA